MIYIIGGNISKKLNERLKTIGVQEYAHLALTVVSIDRSELKRSAIKIKEHVKNATIILTIGAIADRITTYAELEHFCLSSVDEKDMHQIEKNLVECKNFIGRKYYVEKLWPNPS